MRVDQDVLDLDNGIDAVRLRAAFKDLSVSADDQQQLGWSLHEDETIVIEQLATVGSIVVSFERKSSTSS